MTERKRVCHPSGGPVLVKRAEQDGTDVNLIMDSWVHAGAAVAGHMNPRSGQYGDFSSGLDYHTALSAVKEADGLFMCLPPKVRSHVDNDPGKLLDLVYDPERRDELVKLGLVAPVAPDSDAVVKLQQIRDAFKVPKDEDKPSGEERTADGPAGDSDRQPDPAGLFD